jgi:sugar O-acyltransferase (sialic acid O-acetyltransferase NeuD family)
MKKLALIGAGGFANEIRAHMNQFDLKCFVDEKYYTPNSDNISPLSEFDPSEYKVTIAIGDSKARYDIVNRLPRETEYFTYIHPTAQIIGNDVQIGIGSIICAGVIVTTNCIIGDHAHLNLLTTVGHDCRIGNFFTTAPGAKISGNCNIGDRVYFGTNSAVKQKINVCDDVTIGLNSGVVKNIEKPGIYIGSPARILEK